MMAYSLAAGRYESASTCSASRHQNTILALVMLWTEWASNKLSLSSGIQGVVPLRYILPRAHRQ